MFSRDTLMERVENERLVRFDVKQPAVVGVADCDGECSVPGRLNATVFQKVVDHDYNHQFPG